MKPPEATQFLSSASAADIAPAMLSAQPPLCEARSSGGLPPGEHELRHLPAPDEIKKKKGES